MQKIVSSHRADLSHDIVLPILNEPLTDPKLFLHNANDDLDDPENYRANLLTNEINEQLVPEFQEIAKPNADFVKYEKNCGPYPANTQKSVCTIDTVFQAKVSQLYTLTHVSMLFKSYVPSDIHSIWSI